MENERKTTSLFDFISSSQKCMIVLFFFVCESVCETIWKKENGKTQEKKTHIHYTALGAVFLDQLKFESN